MGVWVGECAPWWFPALLVRKSVELRKSSSSSTLTAARNVSDDRMYVSSKRQLLLVLASYVASREHSALCLRSLACLLASYHCHHSAGCLRCGAV